MATSSTPVSSEHPTVVAYNFIYNALETAQKRGAFSLSEASALLSNIQTLKKFVMDTLGIKEPTTPIPPPPPASVTELPSTAPPPPPPRTNPPGAGVGL